MPSLSRDAGFAVRFAACLEVTAVEFVGEGLGADCGKGLETVDGAGLEGAAGPATCRAIVTGTGADPKTRAVDGLQASAGGAVGAVYGAGMGTDL